MAKKHLVIVESPAKAKTIGKYLGRSYTVKASMGHLRDLPKSKLGVDIEHDFEPVYQPIRGKEELISELKKAAKSSDTVYLATDPDREGEAISWHLKYLLNIPDNETYRVTFNEITRNVVQESIQHPRPIDQNLVDAQQARRVLDRIVGYQLSPLLWKKVRRGLSAGRVQSVAVRLIRDRELEIENFKPDEYWNIDALLNPQGEKGEFTARLAATADGKKLTVTNKQQADGILAALFDSFVRYAQSQGTTVILVLSPWHPYLYGYLLTEPENHKGFFQVENWLRQYCADNNVPIYGSYDPACIEGLQETDFFDGLHCGGTGIARFFPGIPQALSDLQNGTLANPLDVHPRTSLEDPNAQPAEGETPDGEVTQQEG